MSKAVKCPVCEGVGVFLISPPAFSTTPTSRVCHGCGGKGWVEIEKKEIEDEI